MIQHVHFEDLDYKIYWDNIDKRNLHREDGPAIECGDEPESWWLNGKFIAVGKRPENWDELVLLAQVERVMND